MTATPSHQPPPGPGLHERARTQQTAAPSARTPGGAPTERRVHVDRPAGRATGNTGVLSSRRCACAKKGPETKHPSARVSPGLRDLPAPCPRGEGEGWLGWFGMLGSRWAPPASGAFFAFSGLDRYLARTSRSCTDIRRTGAAAGRCPPRCRVRSNVVMPMRPGAGASGGRSAHTAAGSAARTTPAPGRSRPGARTARPLAAAHAR